jgi:hypothetical protein
VGLTIDQRRAAEVLRRAYQTATDPKKRVPDDWVQTTKQIDSCPSRTFTVALGTALLARATNPKIDALAIKAETTPTAYSARTLAHNVLVPFARSSGFSLRATGREPLNNQPFFRYDRIDQIDRIHASARPYLPVLIKTCKNINKLSEDEARLALAAFLRERLERSAESVAASVAGTAELIELIPIVEQFVNSYSNGGRVGQAVVAAVFDLAFENVRTGRINDPSRHFTGDVHALTDEGVPFLAAEARQKPVSESDVMTFASGVSSDGVPRALVVGLDASQKPLDTGTLARRALADYSIPISVVQSVSELFSAACTWNPTVLDRMADFPQLLLRRLQEIETEDRAISWWVKKIDG